MLTVFQSYFKHDSMPRSARLDQPGLLQHVIVRGIEKRDIFLDDEDRDDFVRRLSTWLLETETEYRQKGDGYLFRPIKPTMINEWSGIRIKKLDSKGLVLVSDYSPTNRKRQLFDFLQRNYPRKPWLMPKQEKRLNQFIMLKLRQTTPASFILVWNKHGEGRQAPRYFLSSLTQFLSQLHLFVGSLLLIRHRPNKPEKQDRPEKPNPPAPLTHFLSQPLSP